MRLYLIENTPLADLRTAPGDAVAFFRDAQDPDGTAADALRAQGVTVVFAEGVLSRDEEVAIDDWVNNFLGAWWRTGPNPENDFSRASDLSLGFLGAHLLLTHLQPGMIVRAGEIFRHLLTNYADATNIITDIRNGHYPVTTMAPATLPRRTLLETLANGRTISDLKTPLMPTLMRPAHVRHGLWGVLRTWVGGLRPKFLMARLGLMLQKKNRPRIYFFLNHALSKVAAQTVKDADLDVFCDWQAVTGVTPARYDHMLPLPDLSLLWRALGLWKRVRAHMDRSDFAHFKGFDYAPFLKPALKEYCGTPQIITAVRARQTRCLLKRLRPDVVVMNADVPIAFRTAIALQPKMGFRLINIEHGLNSTPYGYWTIGSNHPNMTVVVPGAAHMNMWGRFQPEGQKPRRVILPTQVVAQMTRVRGKRRITPNLAGGRVMILNYSPAWAQTNRRAKKMDRYTLDVLAAAKTLIDRGVKVSLRPQLTFNTDYFTRMVRSSGLEGKIEFDRTPDFADALLNHDVVVTNLTTCYYQSLYAGWPTVFYEPDFDRRDFVGLLGDAAIDPPHAETPDELVALVEEALDGQGRAATFADEFNQHHLERFLGPDPERAEIQLADFLKNEALAAPA